MTTTTDAAPAIRVRMYRVGFGDCFLLTFAGDRHVVIDCGVYAGTSKTGDIGTIEAAFADLAQVTGKKLALVIMTHRHADHIAGFGRFADQWRTFDVEAVWMPVWENEYDKTAKAFQAQLAAFADEVQAHVHAELAIGNTPVGDEDYFSIGNATGVEFGAASKTAGGGGTGPNAKALALLKTGLKHGGKPVTPSYYKAGDVPTLPEGLADIGVMARVLGPPPVTDLDLFKLKDLARGTGEYLAMTAEARDKTARGWEPFSGAWYVDATSYRDEAFAELARDADPAKARKVFVERMQHDTSGALSVAANVLKDALNNQSLVVLFTFGGKNLLFAGDAQAGNWEHWLYETDKATSNPTGPLATRALEILSSVDFYKVGHHGSRNATPRVVAETIRQGAAAMCSTEDGVYGSKSNEGEVPREPLIEQLTKQTRLVRSDQVEVTPPGGKAIHARVDRGALPDGFTQGALWVDLAIDGGDEAPTAKPKTKTKAPAAAKTKKPAAAKKTKKPAAKKKKPAAKPRR